jgi:DNA-binding HxlR family transcriptional regulator
MQKAKIVFTEQIGEALALLQGKWTIQILDAMCERPVRLSQLRRMIPSASKKALTTSLRLLQVSKIIERRDLSTSVLRVEYDLSEEMREPLTALLRCLAEWSKLINSAAYLEDPNSGQ